jgi:hypothetical protein
VSPPAYFDCDSLALSPTVSPTLHPTYSWLTYPPTKSPSPTTSPRPSACTGNIENWVDSYGDGCDWYEQNELPGCEEISTLYQGEMGSATDHCCYCFSNREDGIISNEVAEDGGEISMEIFINISIEDEGPTLEDLADLILPNNAEDLADLILPNKVSIGDDEAVNISSKDGKSILGDLADLISSSLSEDIADLILPYNASIGDDEAINIILNEVAIDEGGISMEISIKISTKDVEFPFEDLADLIKQSLFEVIADLDASIAHFP